VGLLDLVLPVRCAACGVLGASPCPTCAAALAPAAPAAPPPGLDTLAALLRYEGVARQVVTEAKYGHARASLRPLAAAAVGLVEALTPAPVAVTWAPTTAPRARARGYDQARTLATVVARGLGLPVRRCLDRAPGPHQTGRSAAERRVGPDFTPRGRAPASLLLVDDVSTTGATLSAAAGVLRSAGARTVHGLVLARTPAPRARR
jgi:predicted amidophosphoribosyltransferase